MLQAFSITQAYCHLVSLTGPAERVALVIGNADGNPCRCPVIGAAAVAR